MPGQPAKPRPGRSRRAGQGQAPSHHDKALAADLEGRILRGMGPGGTSQRVDDAGVSSVERCVSGKHNVRKVPGDLAATYFELRHYTPPFARLTKRNRECSASKGSCKKEHSQHCHSAGKIA